MEGKKINYLGDLSLKSRPSILIEQNLGVHLLSELSLVPLLLIPNN